MKIELHKLITDLSIEEYHGHKGTYSSSQFKDLLEDEDLFVEKHIKKTIAREEVAAFDVGSYFHTGVLEPHKLKIECIVYPGKARRGAEWERFKAKHKNKAIVTEAQKDQAVGLVKIVRASPVAQNYLNGKPEVSLFVKLWIKDGQIYAPYFGKRLTRQGWEPALDEVTDLRKAGGYFEIIVKVRADMLGKDYVSDLKSTTGNARKEREMRDKISYYNYDLSASLYLDMFSLLRPILAESTYVDGVECSRFVWIFASKDYHNSRSYHGSWKNFLIGRAKYMKAMLKMADCAANGWESVDSIGVLEPNNYELDFLIEKDTDLL